ASDGADGHADAARPDPGPPPACDAAPAFYTLAAGFDGEWDADPDAFVPLSPAGPFAFLVRHGQSGDADPHTRLEAHLVSSAGESLDVLELDEAGSDDLLTAAVAAPRPGGGALCLWGRGHRASGGPVDAMDLFGATVSAEGTAQGFDAPR